MSCIVSLYQDRNTGKVYNKVDGKEYTPGNMPIFNEPPPHITLIRV